MKILFLTPQLPFPPRQGTQIRNYYLLRAAAPVHQVDLLSFARHGESLGEDNPLLELCSQVRTLPVPGRTRVARLRSLLASSMPDVAGRLASQGFADTLRSMMEGGRYDAVQIEGIEMARYIPVVREVAPGAALIFDDHNAEYILQVRAASVDARTPRAWPKAFYSLLQWRKLRQYEARVCASADVVLVVSRQDAAALRGLTAIRRLSVVPNGVDTAYYRPGTANGGAPPPEHPALLFTGTMDFRPNVDAIRWFASRVLPMVHAESPKLRLCVVGRSPAPSVLELAARDPRVIVTGPVEDVRPHFARCDAFVAPLRMGGGVRLKIMEGLAMGVPVVSTRMGAEGIDLVEGKEVLLADDAAGFAAAVLRVLREDLLRRRMAAAGRRAAEERFDWSRITPRLLEVYGGLS